VGPGSNIGSPFFPSNKKILKMYFVGLLLEKNLFFVFFNQNLKIVVFKNVFALSEIFFPC
jgi:hypothetical protein